MTEDKSPDNPDRTARAASRPSKSDSPNSPAGKEARLKAALRANLRRRKAPRTGDDTDKQ
jgi:hypothetical protein